MKPITKKYHSKDLNIAYNDGLEEGRREEQIKILRLLQIKCNCRMRGLEIDIKNQENKDYYTGALNEYDILFRHLSELKYIKADIKCAWKYLSDKEREEYYKLTGEVKEEE